jgi:mitogen-activated protein kinase kinase kinase
MVTASQSFSSPTESEFSDVESPDSAKSWDEDQVCDWLRGINCGEYEKLFRKNNINGENLLEMDKAVLQEMGIDKIGDRVRLFLGIKKLRTKAYANQKKRNRVRLLLLMMTCSHANDGRTRLLASVANLHIRLRLRDHHDLQPQRVPFLRLPRTRDIQDSLRISTLQQQYRRMSANRPRGRVHHWLVQKFELGDNNDTVS